MSAMLLPDFNMIEQGDKVLPIRWKKIAILY